MQPPWSSDCHFAWHGKLPTGNEEGPVSGGEVLLGLLSSLNEGRVIDNERIKATELHEVFYELNRRVRAAGKAESR